MNTQHLLIETLTPLHVGSGRLLQGNTEYLYFPNLHTVSVVDERSVLSIVGEEQLDTWIGIINNGDDLLDYIKKRRQSVTPNDIGRRVVPVLGNRVPGGSQTIREQLFSGNGQPILPGSSLKGSIRTAFLNTLIQQNPAPAQRISDFKQIDERDDYKTGQRKRIVRYKGGALEKKYMGSNPNQDVFRLLRIGDAHFSSTICLLSETLNELGDGSFEMKESVKQFIECIPAGAETICRVQIPSELKARLNETRFRETANKIPHRNRIEWKSLLKDINDNTQRLIQNEIARYQTEHLPDGAAEYTNSLKQMMDGLKPNQCVIRVGFGTGYLNMTGGWAEEQWRNVPGLNYQKEMNDLAEGVRRNARYNEFSLPKSRKMTLSGVPLGFLKLTIFSEAEYTDWQQQAGQREAERLQRIEAKRLADEVVARTAAEAEAQRLEAERLAAEEARKPKLFEGKVKRGSVVDAEVVSVNGSKAALKLYVSGHESDRFPITYNGLAVGQILLVEVKDVSGKGKIGAVGFRGFK